MNIFCYCLHLFEYTCYLEFNSAQCLHETFKYAIFVKLVYCLHLNCSWPECSLTLSVDFLFSVCFSFTTVWYRTLNLIASLLLCGEDMWLAGRFWIMYLFVLFVCFLFFCKMFSDQCWRYCTSWTSAGLTLVPVVPWEGTPTAGGPQRTAIFTTLFWRLNVAKRSQTTSLV